MLQHLQQLGRARDERPDSAIGRRSHDTDLRRDRDHRHLPLHQLEPRGTGKRVSHRGWAVPLQLDPGSGEIQCPDLLCLRLHHDVLLDRDGRRRLSYCRDPDIHAVYLLQPGGAGRGVAAVPDLSGACASRIALQCPAHQEI